MNRIKYDYKRHKLTARVSYDLYKEVHRVCETIGVSIQDYITYSLLEQLDPTEIMEDNKSLDIILKKNQYSIKNSCLSIKRP